MRLRRMAGALAVAGAALLAPFAAASAAEQASLNYPLTVADTPSHGKDAIGLAVNPRNPRHVVGIWADWLAGECEFGMSRDGGVTWRTGELQVPEGFSDAPCTVGPHLAEHINQSVEFGGGNRVYTTFVSPRINESGQPEAKSLFVARSDDGGRTFETAVQVLPGGASEERGPQFTLPRLGVDAGRRNDRIYVAAAEREQAQAGQPAREDISLSISNDSGRTWGPKVRANAADDAAIEQSEPVIARDGSVYLTWRSRGRGERPNQFTPGGYVTLGKSTDRGQTWSQSMVARVTGYEYTGVSAPPFTTQRQFTASTFPRMAVDPDTSALHLVYGDGGTPSLPTASGRVRGADHFINPDEDVWYQRSTDAGATWTEPRRLNGPSPTEITQTRHPQVSVADGGRVDVVWNDRRHWYRGCVHTHNACNETRLGDTYYSFSSNRGGSFSRNRRITDRSSGLDVGYDYRFGTGWAYGPESVPLGRNRILVGWMDTRLGNFENDRQDIFLSRVTVRRAPGPEVERLRARTVSDVSVALSRLTYPGGSEAVLGGTFVTRPFARVVIVNQDDPAAALVGAVLARANIATVLASPADALPSRVRSEIRRLRPIGAFVLGGEDKLSAQVVSQVAASGVPADAIARIDGGSDAGTAALVAAAMDRRTDAEKQNGTPAFDAAVIANPDSPEAATVSAWAVNRRLPVLYVSENAIPQQTTDALNSLSIKRTFVIGSERVIGNAVANGLPAPTRLDGRDAEAVSRAVVRQSRQWQLPTNILYVTDAASPMWPALLGVPAGRNGGLLAVTDRPERDARRTGDRLRLTRALDRIIAVELRRPPRVGR